MALSVGVVSIEYLDEPQSPVSDFLKHLSMNLFLGLENGECWGGSWEGNAFLEFGRDALVESAELWCDDGGIDDSDRAALLAWITALPWRNGYIMLHLG